MSLRILVVVLSVVALQQGEGAFAAANKTAGLPGIVDATDISVNTCKANATTAATARCATNKRDDRRGEDVDVRADELTRTASSIVDTTAAVIPGIVDTTTTHVVVGQCVACTHDGEYTGQYIA